MTSLLSYAFANRHGVLLEPERKQLLLRADCAPAVLSEVQASLRAAGEIPAHYQTQLLTPEQFSEQLTELCQEQGMTSSQLAEDIHDSIDLNSLAQAVPETEDLMDNTDDAPVVKLINAVMREAIRFNSSDIHIETYDHRARIRLRVDGVLQEVLGLRRELAPLLVSRIKIMARLDIAEKRIPQDGRFSTRLGNREVDVRVSTLPSKNCERVVLRLLDKGMDLLTIDALGLPETIGKGFRHGIASPNGIVLVTGPTGSGKTTTLYAALSELNNNERNILTVEDPIEYAIEGVGQTQVNSKVNMSFARGLRAILRQDPDVVMVGEIRDRETAEIAVQASLTGHLVLSTLHTNSAAATVARLLDMGVEPFLMSSTLRVVLAQRLVRRLCKHCRQPAEQRHSRLLALGGADLNPDEPVTVYQAAGCEECGQTGYHGRFGLFELLEVTPDIASLISHGGSEQQLRQAQTRNHTLLSEQGLAAVTSGETSVEEVLRVTRAGL